jgi:hypothetical protein
MTNMRCEGLTKGEFPKAFTRRSAVHQIAPNPHKRHDPVLQNVAVSFARRGQHHIQVSYMTVRDLWMIAAGMCNTRDIASVQINVYDKFPILYHVDHQFWILRSSDRNTGSIHRSTHVANMCGDVNALLSGIQITATVSPQARMNSHDRETYGITRIHDMPTVLQEAIPLSLNGPLKCRAFLFTHPCSFGTKDHCKYYFLRYH